MDKKVKNNYRSFIISNNIKLIKSNDNNVVSPLKIYFLEL
jgi:hypothetical protein